MLTVGTRLGAYEITGSVGAGGMGEVFKAKDSRLGRDVAIKVLPSLFAADPDRLRRFEQEARAAAALNHPNILVVYDVGADGGIPYVVSELLEGQTLRQALEPGALTTRKAVDYGIQIANGLGAAHEKGIVHRDVKPENVFVTKDGRIKILDFGLAKFAEVATEEASRATMASTDPGMVLGTAGYMSPEQLRSEPIDARSDIFSLGAVLYEMFSGVRAFNGKTAVDAMSAILKEDPADFPPAIHAAAPAIERIVRRCLEKNLHERFQSARDVTFALDALSTASGVKSGVVSVPAAKKSLAPIAIAAAVVAIVGAAMYFTGARFGAKRPEPPSITQLTFRRGTVRGARFSPDGHNVLYAAAWEGRPLQLFSTRPGSPESSPLALPSADLMAVSGATNEMLVTLDPTLPGLFGTRGTVARAPLAGGAPRPLLENVLSADFTRDGQAVAAILNPSPGICAIHFPIGTERLKTSNSLTDVRIAPDGQQLAYLSHPPSGDDGSVELMPKTGNPRTLSSGWISIGGLAWANDGRELWFTGTRAGNARALWAVTVDGRERLLYRGTERLMLEDVAADGRVLLSAGTINARIHAGALGEDADRDLSWFDFANGISLSADGKLIAFTESGEGAGNEYGLFVRPTNGDPAVRIMTGWEAMLSPDGRLVAGTSIGARSVTVAPTGAGTPRTFPLQNLEGIGTGRWFPDNRRIAILASEPGRPRRTWELDTATGKVTPLTPEGTSGRTVSPNGRWLAVATGPARQLLDLQTKTLVTLKGGEAADRVVGWTPDSAGVLTFQPDAEGGHVFRLDVASGRRALVKTLRIADRAGLIGVGGMVVALDGQHFAYSATWQPSQLFLLKLPQGR